MRTSHILHLKKFRDILSLIGLLMATGVAPIHAADKGDYDYKIYPAASLCVSPEQSVLNNTGRMAFGSDGAIENPNRSKALTIACPIIRDNTATRSGVEVSVYLQVHNPANPVTCRLTSRNLEGTSFSANPSSVRTVSGNGNKALHLQLSGSDLPPGWMAILHCELPKIAVWGGAKGTRLVSMRVKESP